MSELQKNKLLQKKIVASKWFVTAKQKRTRMGVFLFGGNMRGEMRTTEGGSVETAAKPR